MSEAMVALEEELSRTGVSVDELTDAVRRLTTDLRLVDDHLALSRGERSILRSGSGVSRDAVARAAGERGRRQAGLAVSESVRSTTAWTATEVAQRLAKHRTAVSRMKTAGEVYVLPGRGRDLFPSWQFVAAHGAATFHVIPHLSEVLSRLPHPTHPATMERFFTTPRRHYLLDGHEVSAAEWLAAGGDVDRVLADAESMHVLG